MDEERTPFALVEINMEVSRINTTEVFEKTYRSKDYRLTLWSSRQEGVLYDLNKDPLQLNNVWGEPDYKDIQAELIWQLLQRLMETENTLPARTHPF